MTKRLVMVSPGAAGRERGVTEGEEGWNKRVRAKRRERLRRREGGEAGA
jgi:hypothetical protein